MHDYHVAGSPQAESRLGFDLFVAKRAAGQLNGPWRRGALNTLSDLKWDIAPLPHRKKQATAIFAGGIAVSSETKHPEIAWQFVKYLTGPVFSYPIISISQRHPILSQTSPIDRSIKIRVRECNLEKLPTNRNHTMNCSRFVRAI